MIDECYTWKEDTNVVSLVLYISYGESERVYKSVWKKSCAKITHLCPNGVKLHLCTFLFKLQRRLLMYSADVETSADVSADVPEKIAAYFGHMLLQQNWRDVGSYAGRK